jgi:hypothetical protein
VAHGAKFSSIQAFRTFALAGNAVFTMVSLKTGTRFTYRIRRGSNKGSPFFVQLLNGPDNTTNYAYFGLIFGTGKDLDFASYQYGKAKAKVPQSAPSVQGFEWLIRNIMDETTLDKVELWHQGRCGKCRKPLTVPDSIASGMGPVCARGGRD